MEGIGRAPELPEYGCYLWQFAVCALIMFPGCVYRHCGRPVSQFREQCRHYGPFPPPCHSLCCWLYPQKIDASFT